MKKVVVISYPSDQSNLLSLCDHSSRYELHFAGRFRIVDFTLSIALGIDASKIIFLEPQFTKSLESFSEEEQVQIDFPPIEILKVDEPMPFTLLIDLLRQNDADYFLIINGDNPLITDVRQEVSDLIQNNITHGSITISYQNKPYYTTKMLFSKKDPLIKLLMDHFREIKSFTSLFNTVLEMIKNENNYKELQTIGYFHKINNIVEYYSSNMDILKNLPIMLKLIQNIPLGNVIPNMTGKEGEIKKHGSVIDSILSDSCNINGLVKNSIIFPNVTVEKKAELVNSIVLPNTIIAENSKVTRVVIDETFLESLIKKSRIATIEEDSEVGKEDIYTRNAIYPNAIFNGITLLGPNCSLPKKIKIGSGCYIKAETNKHILKKSSVVKDSETI